MSRKGKTLAILICGVGALSGGPVSAQNTPDPIARNLVSAYGISEDEALRRLRYADQARDLQARLEREEPARFAGLYIDQTPTFRIVVKFVAPADDVLKRYTSDPVFVTESAGIPVATLRDRQDALVRTLRATEPNFASDIDIRSNTLELYVPDQQRVRAMLKTASIAEDGLNIVQVTRRDELVATVQGGENLTGPTQSDGSYEIATTAFVVLSGSTRGVLTAGHVGECIGAPSGCAKNAPIRSAAGVSLIYQAQANAGSDDYEWRTPSGSHTLPNTIRYSSTTMSITATRDPTTFPVGTTVCKQGQTTGYTCGTIESTSSQTTYNGATGYYVRVKNSGSGNMVDSGDSGGPVFGANTAYGIVHSKVTSPSSQAGQMMFMPITRISGLNLSVALN